MIRKRFCGHKRDMEIDGEKNALAKHCKEINQNFNSFDSKMLVNMYNKQHRKIVESSIILHLNAIKQSTHFLKIISWVKFVLKS